MTERATFALDLKADTDSGAVAGIAWAFRPDRVGDVIEPDAFKSVPLPLPMLAFHDMNDPVGTWNSATVEGDGLHMKGRLLVADLPRAREVMALVKSGAVRGLSIGFRTIDAIARKGGGRTIKSLELLECSLVTVPINPGARVTSAKDAIAAIHLAEKISATAARIRTK